MTFDQWMKEVRICWASEEGTYPDDYKDDEGERLIEAYHEGLAPAEAALADLEKKEKAWTPDTVRPHIRAAAERFIKAAREHYKRGSPGVEQRGGYVRVLTQHKD